MIRLCLLAAALAATLPGAACAAPSATPSSPTCRKIDHGYGPDGSTPPVVTAVVDGLEVPWGVAVLPDGNLLVSERPGRLRLVQSGALAPSPVLEVPVASTSEGGLLDVVLHPDFAHNRLFYVVVTTDTPKGAVDRVLRYHLADDEASANLDRVILDGIPAAAYHDGGRLRFGPDGQLYVTTGDARSPEHAQDRAGLSGKVLRVTPDGAPAPGNPWRGSPVLLLGLRNSQGLDWLDDGRLVVTDHGPTGEFGLRGHDEVNVARPGDNLGWPLIYGCGAQTGLVSPLLVWQDAMPPGGLMVYRGPGPWKGSLLVTSLGARLLERITLAPTGATNEVYLRGDPPGGHGRLRTIVPAPDGALYVTTSNCDGRGTCPPGKDAVLRVEPPR